MATDYACRYESEVVAVACGVGSSACDWPYCSAGTAAAAAAAASARRLLPLEPLLFEDGSAQSMRRCARGAGRRLGKRLVGEWAAAAGGTAVTCCGVARPGLLRACGSLWWCFTEQPAAPS